MQTIVSQLDKAFRSAIAAARPVVADVEGRLVAPGVVNRPGSEGSVGFAD